MWFPNRSDTNRAVQAQKRARLYYPSSENKGADQLRGHREADRFAVTAKLICAFVFAYADCWFSHEAAHLFRYFGLNHILFFV